MIQPVNCGQEHAKNVGVLLIAGYSQRSLNRSMHMTDSALQTFSIFNDRPGPEFIDGWRQHIADTGEPEKYPGVSTTKPAKSANVVLLSDEIRVPTAMRPGGDKVPCPLCSPSTGKFGTGRMAYFPDDSATRFIGHDCAKRYLGTNYTEAERLFRIEAQCAAFIQLWPKLQAALPQLNPIVQSLYVVGKILSQLRLYIDAQATGFARTFHGDLVAIGSRVVTSRDQGAKSYDIRGLEFLSKDFNPESDVEKLMNVCRDILSPLPSWQINEGDSPASREIIKRGRAAARRLRGISELRNQIEEAAQFLDPINLNLLEQWRSSGNSPFTVIRFKREGDRIDGVVESYAGRFEWSVVYQRDLLATLPTKEEIAALSVMEIFG